MLKSEMEKEIARLEELYTCANREVSKLSRIVGEQAAEKRDLAKQVNGRDIVNSEKCSDIENAINCIGVLLSVNCKPDLVIMRDRQQGMCSDDRTSDLFNHLDYVARKLDIHYLNRVL